MSAAARQGGNPAEPPRRRLRRGERGAALAEFAICFPVFMLLMLAVVDMGVNFGDQVGVERAARDVARAASVAEVDDAAPCPLTPDGALSASTRDVFCMAKARTQLPVGDVRVKLISDPDGGAIVLCVQTPASSVSGMLGPILDDDVHEARATARTDLPTGETAPTEGEELPLPGHDWSFCTERPSAADTA